MFVVIAFVLVVGAIMVGGGHTVDGFGDDLQTVGQKISDAVRK